jgi:hypothetical protein
VLSVVDMSVAGACGSTSAKYSNPGKSRGSRLMLVAEVALGRVSVSSVYYSCFTLNRP